MRGRGALPAAVPAPGEGLLVPADSVHQRPAALSHRAGGDLRPGAFRADVPHAGRSGGEGEQHAVRVERRGLDGQGLAHPLDGEAAPRGVVWANTYNRFDPTSPFGGYKESGFGREGGSTDSSLPGFDMTERCRSRRRTSCSSAASSRAPSRATYGPKERPTRFAQGRARRGARGPHRVAGLGGGTAKNRGQMLYRPAEMLEPGRPSSPSSAAAARRSRARWNARLVRGLDGQAAASARR